jgi:hypothetical protein
MSRGAHHFPTFASLARAITSPTRHIPKTFWGWLLTERSILRIALYVLLALSVVHAFGTRFLKGTAGGPPFYRYPTAAMWPDGEGASIAMAAFMVTHAILGDVGGTLDVIVAVLCLVGLAASTHRPLVIAMDPADPIEKTPLAIEPDSDPPRPPRPPERHPLDPDPTDPPLAHPWPRS